MTSAPAQTAKLASTRKRMLETALRFQGYLGLLIVFVIGAIFSPVRDNTNLFLDVTNQMNIVRYVATTGIIAIGMTLVILIGEIDLAVGSVLAFVATLTAFLLTAGGMGTLETLVIVLAAGAALGFVNGAITTGLRIPSFVVTLAMMSFARGLARLLFGGVAVPLMATSQGGNAPESAFFFAARVGGIFPVPALMMFSTFRCARGYDQDHRLLDLWRTDRTRRVHAGDSTQSGRTERRHRLRVKRHRRRRHRWYELAGRHRIDCRFGRWRLDARHDRQHPQFEQRAIGRTTLDQRQPDRRRRCTAKVAASRLTLGVTSSLILEPSALNITLEQLISRPQNPALSTHNFKGGEDGKGMKRTGLETKRATKPSPRKTEIAPHPRAG
jgi:hypothetical protein